MHVQPAEIDVVFLAGRKRVDIEVEDEGGRHRLQACRHVLPDRDGTAVGRSGTVRVVAADGLLTLGKVDESRDWSASVIEEQIDEVTVAFTHGPSRRVVEFEAEIESISVEYEVCRDLDPATTDG